MSRRYAIYYAPQPGSDLEAFGRRWLGRDHITGEPVEQPKLEGVDSVEQAAITKSARHYGFHATLKAPFELAADKDAEALHAKAQDFAAARSPFEAPSLQIAALSKWVALTLKGNSDAMSDLAAGCVRCFEDFRASLSAADVERRRKSELTQRQDEQLVAFGYPYIFEDFHFHMTLAGPLNEEQRERVQAVLQTMSPSLDEKPFLVDAIAIYEQASRDQPFIQTARIPFSGQ